MERAILVGLLCLVAQLAMGQEDKNKVMSDEEREATLQKMKERAAADSTGKIWNKGGLFQLNMSQVELVNWSAGGFSSISGMATVNSYANRRKARTAWDNNIAMAYGLLAQRNKRTFKTDDRLELNSRFGYKLRELSLWYASALFQVRTQFTEGYDPFSDTVKISSIMTPGYVIFGLGVDYKPMDKFSLFISPATAKIVLKLDPDLIKVNAFGVDSGKTSVFQMGGYVNMSYSTELAKNVTFLTRLDLFSNYLNEPANIDVNWEMLFTFRVNDWLAANINTLLIYDDDIDIARLEGETPKLRKGWKKPYCTGFPLRIKSKSSCTSSGFPSLFHTYDLSTGSPWPMISAGVTATTTIIFSCLCTEDVIGAER